MYARYLITEDTVYRFKSILKSESSCSLSWVEMFRRFVGIGYIKYLHKEIDNKYCLKNNGYYNYELRNTTTYILNISLISSDNIECAIFIETGNSFLKNIGRSRETLSPWIYAENIAMNMLRPHLDRASKISQESHKIGDGGVAMDSLPEIRFSLENIPELSSEILDQVILDKKRGKGVLDFFYVCNSSGSSYN
ncbi:hypothetical protein [Saccharibacter floricola]|uniref:Uncharacterized protein n=1 Tax=Saccharibacter floricola DSM 15669 TaxID=1123227 RepID=A0ABQ0P020_9PROT|nr:hypothetical protein [Saccharibacter floricola]GBQ07834.1 hypothetical protein AA15669_1555 [Saccharibacter floricola DSM 15669]